jgi:anthraniloyl-CoA monooxygenase
LGGGPAGLYFAISMKLRDPSHEVTVVRAQPRGRHLRLGRGAVRRNARQSGCQRPESAEAIRAHFAYWDDIALWSAQGKNSVSGGHGFCGIGRKQTADPAAGARPRTRRRPAVRDRVGSRRDYRKDYDLVVAADGINSRTRTMFEDVFKPDIDVRKCKFVWLGTHQKFDDAFTFIFEKTEHGWVWAHAYQFDDDTATFIVECMPETFEPGASAT